MANSTWKPESRTEPVNGQTISLEFLVKKQIVVGKDDKGQPYEKTYFVNVSEGAGRFKHGKTILTLPNGDRITVLCEVRLMKPKESQAVTVESSAFSFK